MPPVSVLDSINNMHMHKSNVQVSVGISKQSCWTIFALENLWLKARTTVECAISILKTAQSNVTLENH